MSTGRTHPKYLKVYVGGQDLTGETRSVGPLAWDHEYTPEAALSWEVQGGLCGQPTITTGQINTIFRFDTTAGISPHDWLNGFSTGLQGVMIPFGIRAVPAAGDPVWMAMHYVSKVDHTTDAPMMTVTMDFQPTFYGATTPTLINIAMPWGKLAHAMSAATGANSATGLDDAASTSAGAWMMCQFNTYGGTGNATVTLQEADTNSDGSFGNITGLTTGAIAHTSMPCAVFAQTAATAAIKRYIRWQISLSSLTSCTFALSYARGK